MKATFIMSAPSVDVLPPSDWPEVAFVGRSNVGKSSLLNRVAGAKIARTSKTPGRTQMLNLFRVERDGLRFGLVDLPGYGFADAPRDARAGWMEMVEGYLERRENLRAVLALVDARRGVEEEDREIFAWIAERKEARCVVTKLDKLSKATQKPALAAIASAHALNRERVFGTSATSGQGVEALLEEIGRLTGG